MEQLTLFNLEDSVTTNWVKFHRFWRGEFCLINQTRHGNLTKYQCQYQVFAPDAKHVTIVEIITYSIAAVEQDFCDTVDQFIRDRVFHQNDSWNPDHFGPVPHKADGDQLTIFYDDSDEPSEPDDYPNLTEYHQAWTEWEIRVGAQVKADTLEVCVPCFDVGAQVTADTEKSAPQHDTPTHWVEKYWVERSGNKYWYYRYCWMVGRKKHRRYLGGVSSLLGRRLKVIVEDAIADGQLPSEIENFIRSQKSKVRG
ncbi:C-5 cytosine-specific DNA methylase (plasmid) [Nostoc sp. NIES-4103]|nr:C-5 cytosine-specific DNA methylase [Nostoc sp. NIES-4103]